MAEPFAPGVQWSMTSPSTHTEEFGMDPWQHRSVGMRCHTCMWWVVKSADVGRCRRHAPTMGGYPVVRRMDWCGDHRLDETQS